MVKISSFQSNLSIQYIKLIVMVFVMLHRALPLCAQDVYVSNEQVMVSTEKQITVPLPAFTKKRFWIAAGEWSMMQLLPWASNFFIRKADFAKISAKSIAANREPANMEWDDNKFFNNQFSHPYQGSLYFNAFRNNGFNFWQSIPAAITGSLAWETLMETHYPAPNDLINTSLGGIAFGEMSHRISEILNSKKRGWKRSLAAPLSFGINPLGVTENRVVSRRNGGDEPAYANTAPVSFVTDAGVRLINAGGRSAPGGYRKEAFVRIHLQYGNPFENCKTPFSAFSLAVEAGSDDSGKANILQIEGSLWGRTIKKTGRSVFSYNVSMNYDFFKNASFVYGAQSFSVNFLSALHFSDQLQVQAKAGAGIIPLAAVPNPYMYYGEGRNYDYCTGINFRAGVGINLFNRLFYNFNMAAACFKTVDGYRSTHVFYSTGSSLRLVVYKKISIEAAADNYYFGGNYTKYPDMASRYQFLHFGLGYKMLI